MDIVKKIETPYNNAVAVLNRTNELLNENNIMDSTGSSIAQLEQNVANPAWLFALACGSLHTAWQEKIAKAYSALDPQNCEDDQVLVLASLAGIKRGNGTPSHITAIVTNTGAEQITLPIGTTFTETYANQTWVLNKKIIIPANGQQYITLYTTTDGDYNVPIGVPFNYDGELPIVLESTTNSSGGSDIETLASLRNRISSGLDATNFIVQAKKAIELLGGVDTCTIWFNTSSEDSLVIGENTSSRIDVVITNTGTEDEEVPPGTIFTDPTLNKQWQLLETLSLSVGEQMNVTLYSVAKEDLTVAENITFTYSGDLHLSCVSTADSIFGSITIPPREAYISVKGYDFSGKLAETYYTYLDVPATVGEQQEECVVGQQPLTVNFDYAQEVPIKIYVTMRSADMAVGADGAVKNAIASHSGTLECGENVTSQMVSEWVQNLGYGTIIDCSVGSPTGMMSDISPTEYCIFRGDNIVVNAI